MTQQIARIVRSLAILVFFIAANGVAYAKPPAGMPCKTDAECRILALEMQMTTNVQLGTANSATLKLVTRTMALRSQSQRDGLAHADYERLNVEIADLLRQIRDSKVLPAQVKIDLTLAAGDARATALAALNQAKDGDQLATAK